MGRKRKSRSKASKSNANDSVEEKAWHLERMLSIEELKNEFVIMCDADGCDLQAWLACEQSKANNQWNTCIDCMLKDFDDWPSNEICQEANVELPISIELETHVRSKCTIIKDASIPPHISANAIDMESTFNSGDGMNLSNDKDVPPLKDNSSISNDNTGKSIGKVRGFSLSNKNDYKSAGCNGQDSIELDESYESESNENQTSASSSKRPKKIQRTSFSARMIGLQQEGVVDLNPKVRSAITREIAQEGYFITCVPCLKFRPKASGQISLRRRHYEHYYDEHCMGAGHIDAIETFKSLKKTKGKNKLKTHKQEMIDSFLCAKKNDEVRISAGNNEDKTKKSSNKSNCVGVLNSMHGPKRKLLPAAHKHLKIQPTSAYEYGCFKEEPAIYSKKCDGVGKLKAQDGGLSCYECECLRKRPGNSNPVAWVTKCYYQVSRILDYRHIDKLTESDYHQLQCFLKVPKVNERHTELGLLLHKECQHNYECLKEMIKLEKQMNDSKPKSISSSYNSSSELFENAAEMHEKQPKFRSSLIVCLLKSAVYQNSAGVNSIKKENKLVDFCRHLQSIDNQSCKFVAANLGLHGIGISDRWLRVLNSKDRGENVFKCEVKDVQSSMKKLINNVKDTDNSFVFSIAIDGTKAPQNLSINTGRKCIMGATYPNHIIDTANLGKECILNIIDNKKNPLCLAQEVKVATMCIQNPKKGSTPMAVIAARPQGINEVSKFTEDVCKAAELLVSEYDDCQFTNFAVDGVSVETKDVMRTQFKFLDGKCNYLGSVDNKHNVKNHRYQYIGGSNVASIGNNVIDVNLLLQSNISLELIRPKDFSSDKKVEDLFSYGTASKVQTALLNGEAIGKLGDYCSLMLTFLMSKLHLHAVNSSFVTAKHRSVYIVTTMLFFVTIDGISPISKRNMVLESIANAFLVLNKSVAKVRHTTSELCEHMFGNMRQERREFTCSEFSNMIDKQNRRMGLNFRSQLSVTNDNVSGYQETMQEFLQAAFCEEDSTGPCVIDALSKTPVSEQQWPQVRQVLNKCIEHVGSMFTLLEVRRERPFSNKITTREDLMKEILKFCPKSFTYRDMTGSISVEDDEIEDNESNKVPENDDSLIVENIKKHVEGILKAGDIEDADDDDREDVKDNNKKVDEIVETDVGASSKKDKLSRREIKRDAMITKNRDTMNAFLNVLHCTNKKNLPSLCLDVWQHLENVERGSLSQDTKANSLLGRWFSKAKKEFKSKEEVCKELLIERDRVIVCSATKFVMEKEIKKEIKSKQLHRVLAVHTKSYNKWFMTPERQMWSRNMKEEDLIKYRCAVRMLTDGYVDDYEDVDLNSNEFKLKDMVKIVSGVEIIDVKDSLFAY